MNDSILNSIIELTSKRDADSLEVSLILTIFEIFQCQELSLYYCDVADETVTNVSPRLDIVASHTGNEGSEWQIKPLATPYSSQVQEVCTRRQPFREQEAGYIRHWIGVPASNNQLICLALLCNELEQEQYGVLRALIKIYINYFDVICKSERDQLTGLLNRNSLETRYKTLLKKQEQVVKQKTRSPERRHLNEEVKPWMALIDIDHFKQINDNYGHLCGDEVLLTLAQLMKSYFRNTDLLFRYGGEEFLLVLQPISEASAIEKLNDFVQWLSEQQMPLIGNLTVSVGFTSASPNEYFRHTVERADMALYYCKEHGRNCVGYFEALEKKGLLSLPDQSRDLELF